MFFCHTTCLQTVRLSFQVNRQKSVFSMKTKYAHCVFRWDSVSVILFMFICVLRTKTFSLQYFVRTILIVYIWFVFSHGLREVCEWKVYKCVHSLTVLFQWVDQEEISGTTGQQKFLLFLSRKKYRIWRKKTLRIWIYSEKQKKWLPRSTIFRINVDYYLKKPVIFTFGSSSYQVDPSRSLVLSPSDPFNECLSYRHDCVPARGIPDREVTNGLLCCNVFCWIFSYQLTSNDFFFSEVSGIFKISS